MPHDSQSDNLNLTSSFSAVVATINRVFRPSRKRQRMQYRDIVNHHEIHCVRHVELIWPSAKVDCQEGKGSPEPAFTVSSLSSVLTSASRESWASSSLEPWESLVCLLWASRRAS